jgi:beta-lactam-binding protein with PASTA domain
MPFGRRVWGVGKVLLLLGALAATFLLFFVVSMRVAIRAGQVQVPDLTRMTVDEATRTLQDLELRARVEEARRPDMKIPVGRIAQQDPPAGEAARPQRTVKLWVSDGPRTTPVPALVGQTERTARIRLDQDGIELGTVTEVQSSDYPPDTIVAQDPAPPARAPKVSILINRGDQTTTYVMPDVIGMDGSKVETTLRGAGFRVTIVGSQAYAGVPANTVVRQQPASGYEVGPADAISLEVSR